MRYIGGYKPLTNLLLTSSGTSKYKAFCQVHVPHINITNNCWMHDTIILSPSPMVMFLANPPKKGHVWSLLQKKSCQSPVTKMCSIPRKFWPIFWNQALAGSWWITSLVGAPFQFIKFSPKNHRCYRCSESGTWLQKNKCSTFPAASFPKMDFSPTVLSRIAKDTHPSKASCPMWVTDSPTVMFAREVQPAKARSPIWVTDSPKVTLSREAQFSNAKRPIWVTDSPNVMLARKVQFLKAPSPTFTTDLVKEMLTREVQARKA